MAYPDDDPNILTTGTAGPGDEGMPSSSMVSPEDQSAFLRRLAQQGQRVPSSSEFPDIGGRAVLQNVTGAPVPTDPNSYPAGQEPPTYGQRFLKNFAANLLGVGGQMLMAEQHQKMAYDMQERQVALQGIQHIVQSGGAVTPDMLKSAKMDPKSAQFLNIIGAMRRQQIAQAQSDFNNLGGGGGGQDAGILSANAPPSASMNETTGLTPLLQAQPRAAQPAPPAAPATGPSASQALGFAPSRTAHFDPETGKLTYTAAFPSGIEQARAIREAEKFPLDIAGERARLAKTQQDLIQAQDVTKARIASGTAAAQWLADNPTIAQGMPNLQEALRQGSPEALKQFDEMRANPEAFWKNQLAIAASTGNAQGAAQATNVLKSIHGATNVGSEHERLVGQYIADRKLPDTAENRIKANAVITRADPKFQESQNRLALAERIFGAAVTDRQYKEYVTPVMQKAQALADVGMMDRLAKSMADKGLLPATNATRLGVQGKAFQREWLNPTDPDFVTWKGLFSPVMIGEIDRSLYNEKGVRAIQTFRDQFNMSDKMPSYQALHSFFSQLQSNIREDQGRLMEIAKKGALSPESRAMLDQANQLLRHEPQVGDITGITVR